MKKILVITYYWPPAGGPGVQRWLKFVTYLRDFGIDPTVYIPENPHYPIQDTSLLKELPEGITILKHPIREPYGIAGLLFSRKTKRISSGIIQTKKQSLLEKALLWVRGNLFIPDARKNWVKPSIAYLSEVIERENIATIITTGPPHSVHLIGHGLKEKLQLNWLADFRDPWTSIGYHKKLKLTKKSEQKHKDLEKMVLNGADKLIVTSRTTKIEFQHLSDTPISVITNGYESDYQGGADLDESFTIAHIGSLLSGRNPKNLWKTLSDIARENAVFRTDLRLEFIGVVSEDVLDTIYRYELAPYLKLKGYVSHAEALRRQQRAQVLLLVEIDSEETKGIIPGKLYEYMAAKRPILAVGPEGWDASEIVEDTLTGAAFDYNSRAELKAMILAYYTAYKKGQLYVTSKDTEQYSRKALTKKLAELV
ncbi:glycosyltransferase family 4 protein [Aggregatimonas sangjinii]|uniref:Glycosyltransferase family 4 protein n=1 Tax=Aggregatimonas sangjinii TaxID=2583587 RepID=A0A5B7SNL3_9FLAO|nr:glycosyltransferase family 4 protein [Aggregatimonas sangjinii]QCX00146.1 glycosyltransferase family 4 protein [Aggregatimonas sangjinii]